MDIKIKKGGLYSYVDVFKNDKVDNQYIFFYENLTNNANITYKSEDGHYIEIDSEMYRFLKKICINKNCYFLALDDKPIVCLFRPWTGMSEFNINDLKSVFYSFLYEEKIYYLTSLMVSRFFKLVQNANDANSNNLI